VVALLGLLSAAVSGGFFDGFVKEICIAVSFVVIGAATALDGGISRRLEAWPLFDLVIDWGAVAEKAGSIPKVE
jgi:hypothetical protein